MSDTSGSGFGRFMPGFDFLQGLAAQGSSAAAPGLGGGLPHLASWIAPTFNVEDVEKRIEELKAVHFWLDQNTKALAATIQALEVQKMTLVTLKTMNVSLGEVAEALKVKEAVAAPSPYAFGPAVVPPAQPDAAAPARPGSNTFAGLEIPPRTYGTPPAAAPHAGAPDATTPQPAPEAPGAAADGGQARQADTAEPAAGATKRRQPARRGAASAAAASAPGGVDPMAWWGALSQQFQQIAAAAMSDLGQAGAVPGAAAASPAAGAPPPAAVPPASGRPSKAKARATGPTGAGDRPAQQARAPAPRRAAAKASRPARASRPVAPPVAPAPPRAAAAPRRQSAASAGKREKRGPSAPQPLMAGDWLLPAAMFPTLLSPASGAESAPARGRKAAPAAARKPAPAQAPRARRR